MTDAEREAMRRIVAATIEAQDRIIAAMQRLDATITATTLDILDQAQHMAPDRFEASAEIAECAIARANWNPK